MEIAIYIIGAVLVAMLGMIWSLKHDISALSERVSAFSERTAREVHALSERTAKDISALSERVTALSERVAGVSERVARVEVRLDALVPRPVESTPETGD